MSRFAVPDTSPANDTAPVGIRPEPPHPSPQQRSWLARGLAQPGGKLPLFDEQGQRISAQTIRSCIEQGWAEPWFSNAAKPDWLVCKLTERGRIVAQG